CRAPARVALTVVCRGLRLPHHALRQVLALAAVHRFRRTVLLQGDPLIRAVPLIQAVRLIQGDPLIEVVVLPAGGLPAGGPQAGGLGGPLAREPDLPRRRARGTTSGRDNARPNTPVVKMRRAEVRAEARIR